MAHKTAKDNRELMLEKLRYLEIKSVTVSFSGSNDSGDLHVTRVSPLSEEEEISATLLDETPVPAADMPDRYEYVNSKTILRDWKKRPPTLHELIEEVCYGELEMAHGGWEINDGTWGTITIEPLASFHKREQIRFDINYYEPDDYDSDEDEYNDE